MGRVSGIEREDGEFLLAGRHVEKKEWGFLTGAKNLRRKRKKARDCYETRSTD